MIKPLKELLTLINSKAIIATILIIFIGSTPAIFLENLLYTNVFNQLINCFTANFHLVLLILVISINVITLSNEFKNSNMILRYKNYHEYLKFCLKKNLMYVFLILLISFFFCIFTSLVSVEFKLKIISYYYYDISNITYFLFTLIKTITFLNLISIVIFYFNQKFGNKPTLLLISLILITFYIPVTINNRITSIFKMPFLLGHWFYNLPYSSFILEIFAFIIQGLLLFIISLILKSTCINFRKDI